MGFWGKLARAAGRLVGSAVETVGNALNNDVLRNIGSGLQDMCQEVSHLAGETDSYDPDIANASDAEQMADILASFSVGLKGQAQALEEQVKGLVNSYFENLTGAMREVLGNSSAVHNMEIQKRLAIQNIDNQLLNVLSQRVSLSDPECLRILKKSKGRQKEKDMEAFGRKVIREGLDGLCKSLESAFATINNSLTEELDGLADQQRYNTEEMVAQLNKMIEKLSEDADSKEDAILLPAQKLVACELVTELLDERKSA